MAQEDRALALRGLILFAAIGVLVAIVLAIMFWRSPTPPTSFDPPERHVPAVIVPHVGAYPSSISWYAIYQLGETLPSPTGWEIRYNAATTFARRGSDKVPWALLREMLDEKQQMRNYRVRNAEGRDVYDEAAARLNMVSALRAIAAWHDKRKAGGKTEAPAELREIYPLVDALAASPIGELKLQAEKARATFFR